MLHNQSLWIARLQKVNSGDWKQSLNFVQSRSKSRYGEDQNRKFAIQLVTAEIMCIMRGHTNITYIMLIVLN